MQNPQSAPHVTVLFAVRNGMPFVEQSVQSILQQTYTKFELLVLDDGSTDETPQHLARLSATDERVRVITLPQVGLRAALNAGIAAARGELLARMDADDVALPERFQWQVNFLSRAPEVLAVGGQALAMDEEGDVMFSIRYPTDTAEIERSMLRGQNCMIHPTMMLRKCAVLAAGGYQEEYPTDDYGLWLRILELGPIANLPMPVLKYRMHPKASSITKHAQQMQASRRILGEALARRGIQAEPAPIVDHAPQSVGRLHHHWAMSAVRDGFWKSARKHSIQALKYEPLNLHGWWTLCKALMHLRRVPRW